MFGSAGNFGDVFKAVLDDISTVAVKSVQGDYSTSVFWTVDII